MLGMQDREFHFRPLNIQNLRQKLVFLFKEYLTFNQQEQKGIAVLTTILFLLVLATIYYPRLIPDKSYDFSAFEKEIIAFNHDVAVLDSVEEAERKRKELKKEKNNILYIELNSADTLDLQRLRGIGPSFARRIVKYRERLGGFYDKSQLLEVWGMDTGRYHGIAANLTVNPDSIKKMDLNKVTFKRMLAHPYFPFEAAKVIILYRKEHKLFQNVEELREVHGIHDSLYRKMVRYLEVSGK
jgi:DNA uptake protein ComE-like DNA-binding protein